MKAFKPSQTAIDGASIRAFERNFKGPDRLFEDAVSIHLLPWTRKMIVYGGAISPLRNIIWNFIEKKFPGAFGDFLPRTASIDEEIIKADRYEGLRQMIILGAGLDTRAFRMKELSNWKILEIDHPATQNYKIKKLKQAHIDITSNISFIPSDFLKSQDWHKSAKEHIDFKKPVFVLAEGLISYLPPLKVHALLEYALNGLALNSMLHLTFNLNSDSPILGFDKLDKYVTQNNEPFLSSWSIDSIEKLISKYNFRLIHKGIAPEIHARYFKQRRNPYCAPDGAYIFARRI